MPPSNFAAPVAQLDRAPGFEPGGRRFESVRARQLIKNLAYVEQAQCTEGSENVAVLATFSRRTRMSGEGCRSMRRATEFSFSGARCA